MRKQSQSWQCLKVVSSEAITTLPSNWKFIGKFLLHGLHNKQHNTNCLWCTHLADGRESIGNVRKFHPLRGGAISCFGKHKNSSSFQRTTSSTVINHSKCPSINGFTWEIRNMDGLQWTFLLHEWFKDAHIDWKSSRAWKAKVFWDNVSHSRQHSYTTSRKKRPSHTKICPYHHDQSLYQQLLVVIY